jgi:CelD/BcsL family acetyltransferase involved in cellulose biosynthesis
LRITLYEHEDVLREHRSEWDELLTDSAANQIFLTSEWQSTWWEAYQPGQLRVLVVREEGGRWMGLAPWFIGTSPDGRRTMRTIGCVDVTDYLDIVARHGHEPEVFEAIAGWVAAHTDAFDEILLCNIPETSLALKGLPAAVRAHGLASTVRLQEVCPIVTLPDTFASYLDGLDKKNRHELRRKLRRAADEAAWYIVGPEHDLVEELAHFMALMAASSEQKAAFLRDAENRRFFELMVPLMAGRGWLQLAFLTVRGERAAAYLNFTYDRRVLVYNSGLAPLAYGHLSPGIVLLSRLIEHAIEGGYHTFDFLRGDEPYKYDMGGRDTGVYQLMITAPGSAAEPELATGARDPSYPP